jgi:hypothetical protein
MSSRAVAAISSIRPFSSSDVGTPPGQHTADRGGEPAPLSRRLELGG